MVLVERGDKNRGHSYCNTLSLNAFVLSQFELEILHQEIYIETKCDIAVDVFNLGLLAPPPLALGPWIAVCHV